MCIPAIAFFVVFNYAPMPGIWIAFTNFNYRDGIFGSPFVGFKNFEFLIKSGQLWLLTRNTVLYNLAFIVLGNVLAISFAVMLNEIRLKYFKKITQSIMFLPYFISVVLVGVIAFNLLNYDNGALNGFIEGVGGEPIKVYSTPGAWPGIITLTHLWQSTGYGTIVYFAAIMGIDRVLFEAAAIDGASAWQRIRYVILPSLKPIFVILLLFALGGIMHGNFGLFWNLVGNNGGAVPDHRHHRDLGVPHGDVAEQLHDVHGGGPLSVDIRIRDRHHRELDRPENEPRLCTLLISPRRRRPRRAGRQSTQQGIAQARDRRGRAHAPHQARPKRPW